MPKRAHTDRQIITTANPHKKVAGNSDLPAWVEAATSMLGLVGSVARQMPATRLGPDVAVVPQIQPTQERLLTISEVAEQLAVSRKTVWRMIKRGELPVARFGRRIMRVRLRDLVAMISSGRAAGKYPGSRPDKVRE